MAVLLSAREHIQWEKVLSFFTYDFKHILRNISNFRSKSTIKMTFDEIKLILKLIIRTVADKEKKKELIKIRSMNLFYFYLFKLNEKFAEKLKYKIFSC